MFATLAFGIFTCLFGVTMAAECSLNMGEINWNIPSQATMMNGKESTATTIFINGSKTTGPGKKIQIHIPGAKITYQQQQGQRSNRYMQYTSCKSLENICSKRYRGIY